MTVHKSSLFILFERLLQLQPCSTESNKSLGTSVPASL